LRGTGQSRAAPVWFVPPFSWINIFIILITVIASVLIWCMGRTDEGDFEIIAKRRHPKIRSKNANNMAAPDR